jgi:hypothetical protein
VPISENILMAVISHLHWITKKKTFPENKLFALFVTIEVIRRLDQIDW